MIQYLAKKVSKKFFHSFEGKTWAARANVSLNDEIEIKSHQTDNEAQEEQDSAIKQRPPVSGGQHLMGTCNSCSTLWWRMKQALLK